MKITINAGAFAEAVAWTAHALPRSSPHPVLNGIRLEAVDGELALAAFDYDTSRRCTVPADVADDGLVLLPGRVLAEVAKALPAGDVYLHITDGMVAVSAADRRTTFRLLDPEYPKWRKLLDFECEKWATLDNVAELAAAIRRVALVAERATPVRLRFAPRELTVSAGGGEVGRGQEVVDVDYDGEPFEIAAMPAYLLNAFAAFSSRARVGMNDPHRPMLFVPPGVDPELRYLVMPIRQS
ncbi:DNA polymerase III subunit beta [Planomonospora venezuelensis]|uniref:DNA polymerase III sliding clamp (Beta) subunit (PCNA family) n=1 Tax=Planomonospora venezuelensis TaxID=1999 RepID=A0A841D6H1_PLAVE|nr:DNA polymerase III subunit beta [Planomonospora venezuelensis]MBB5965079.1 DNA polymerase III sliding clamp (beta) subunit (PCNA family) [Planomonospora venezuelensis]GIN05003.1 hypothetical protein Pve01_66610 [Planomonospora venezuelensis]